MPPVPNPPPAPSGGWKTVPTTAEPIPSGAPLGGSGNTAGIPPAPYANPPSPAKNGGRDPYWLRDPWWKKAPAFPKDEYGNPLRYPSDSPFLQKWTDPIHPGSPYSWKDLADGRVPTEELQKEYDRAKNRLPDWLRPLPSKVSFPEGTYWDVFFRSQGREDRVRVFSPPIAARAIPSDPTDITTFQNWAFVVDTEAGQEAVTGIKTIGPVTSTIVVVPPNEQPRPYEPTPEPAPIAPPVDWAPLPYAPIEPIPVPMPPQRPYSDPRQSPREKERERPLPPIIPTPDAFPPPVPFPRNPPSPAPRPRPPRSPDRRSPAPGDRDYDSPRRSPLPGELPDSRPLPPVIPFPLPLPDLKPVPRTDTNNEPIPQVETDGSGDDCVNVLLPWLKELNRKQKEFECDCCKIENVTVSVFDRCDTVTGYPLFQDVSVPVLEGTGIQIQRLFDELAEVRSQECFYKPQNVNPSLIDSGVSSHTERAFYTPVSSEMVSVIVIITGELPPSLTLYSTSATGEAQAKFGNIAYCALSPAGGYAQDSAPGWLWTRRTFYTLPEVRLESGVIRLSLQPGLSWVMYDSGERRAQ